MTTGHPNAGYDKIVTRFELALNNPSGARANFKPNKEELKDIMSKSKSLWSVKDTYETTYGSSYRDYEFKEKPFVRPSSPTRKNNPHPPKVFMSSHLRDIPGYFNDNPAILEKSNNNSIETQRPLTANPSVKRPESAVVYNNTNEYFSSLFPNEASEMENTFTKAGVDTNVKSTNESRSQTRNDFEHTKIITTADKQRVTLQSNLLNPYLYDDYREYREKYANKTHGMLNPDRKRPSRGDFMIHPDWHARLKHHRLPCDC